MDAPAQLRASVARRAAGASMAVTGLVGVLLIVGAAWNPWRLVALHYLAHPLPTLIIAMLAGAALAAGGFMGLRGRRAQIVAGLVVPIAVAAILFGLLAWWADSSIGRGSGEGQGVIAISPDNRFEIIASFEEDGLDYHVTHLVVRTRQGLLSRQGGATIADCSSLSVSRSGNVRFIGPTSVAIVVDDRVTVTVQFEPETLVSNAKPTC